MSLNNIQLQDFIVGELYKDTLLFSPDGPPVILHPSKLAAAPAETIVSPAERPAVPPAPTAVSVPPPVMAPVSTTAPAQPPTSQSVAPAPPPAASKAPVPPPVAPKAPAAPEATLPARVATQDPAGVRSPDAPPYKFLGNNQRKVTILVNAPGSAFLPDNQLNFLTKILEACRMNIGDVAIVNHATTPVVVNTLREQLQPSAILLFGIEPTAIRLPINFPVFKLQPYDQCTYLSAPSLDGMVVNSEESKLLKSKLWVCLKTLFNV
jgi:hypothetical protein